MDVPLKDALNNLLNFMNNLEKEQTSEQNFENEADEAIYKGNYDF